MSIAFQTEFTGASVPLQRSAVLHPHAPAPGTAGVPRPPPGMTDVVEKASAETRREFGDTAELTLELYHDPEIDDQYLILCVRQAAYEKHIMDRIEAVRARYRDALADKSGWLHVTTDFCPPGTNHVLKSLADGPADAYVTTQARASLERREK